MDIKEPRDSAQLIPMQKIITKSYEYCKDICDMLDECIESRFNETICMLLKFEGNF